MMRYLSIVKMLMINCFLVLSSLSMAAPCQVLEFSYLTNRDGLSNAQVNTILQDEKGFMWFGTQSGLDRYDGFRFKNFFYKSMDVSSIPDNSVDEIQQDVIGCLWIHTSVGYCIYQYKKERFDRSPEIWLKSIGIDMGNPHKVFIEPNKNMWFVEYGKGCYFLDVKTMKHRFFSFAQMGLKDAKEVHSFTEQNGTAVLSFKDGTLCRIDGRKGKVLWTNRYLTKTYHLRDAGAFSYVDNLNNYWVLTDGSCFIYSSLQKKWYEGVGAFLKSQGIQMPTNNRIFVRDIAKDQNGKLWIATDHDGLLLLDYKQKSCLQYLRHEGVAGSLPDNSLQRIFIDKNQGVWMGSNKGGIAYYSPSSTKFSTIPLGDICTITQDKMGNYWCGTNDAGIVCYNPLNGVRANFSMAQTGLRSDIVVSSITMSDGTMFFGTYNGGLARLKNGGWKTYFPSPNGLASNSVWSLAEDKHHRLVIGTLGGGLQFMDTENETFKTLNIENSKLPSNYINSLQALPNGDIVIGHSQNFSVVNVDTYKFANYNSTKGGMAFPSPGINHMIQDSRGIFWMATPAGITMYDPASGQMEIVNELNGTQGAVGCSVVEDKAHNIWLISEFIVSHVKLEKDNHGKWALTLTSYNSMDGLQDRQFNYRSAFLSANGDLAIGGQDGINIIHTQRVSNSTRRVKALFSGLVLFDRPLVAGEEYEGKVVLESSLDDCRKLNLGYKDNAFTVQLASSDVSVPSRNRFLYRMAGVSDKWMMTPLGRPEVTFTNLSSGSYTLQVKVVNGDGTVCEDVSELEIYVAPPFYLSIWAWVFYVLLAVVIGYLIRKRALDRQKEIFEREKMEENLRKNRELNELKLNFFTNVSHELRTPLTLIISPLSNMIKTEQDEGKKRKLELIYRNAERLLNLVNQILDFRKIEQNSGKLSLTQVEAVSFVQNICHSFQLLGNAKIKLLFASSVSQLPTMFDVDKLGKIVNNLLSNAYKFTPDGGSVTVNLDVVGDMLQLKVADTGKGISDADKQHIFDRFYQVNGAEMQPFGGSGIGLNLVKAFSELHGGTVAVADNLGGGTIFTVHIPLRKDESLKHVEIKQEVIAATEIHPVDHDAGLLADSAEQMATPSSPTTPGKKPKVLLVDDSDDFREFMHEVLSENYEVEEAVNGKEAWDKLQGEVLPDIILSDVMMPVMDGNAFCRLVKNNDRTAAIPFVMLTARLANEHKKEGYENGADEYVTKPFDIDLLNIRIKNLIRKSLRITQVETRVETHIDGAVRSQTAEAAQDGTALQDTPATEVDLPSETPAVSSVMEEETAESLGAATEEYVMTEADKRFMETVDKYIQESMGDPDTSVESMSSHLCISRVQLYKKLVSFTGTTPSEYLRAKRIHWAEELLHSKDYTISEIAYKVGFNNPRYFSKYFQDEYGMTPSQYRKKLMDM